MKFELGFLGAGNMAEAIVRAAIGRDVVPAAQIVSADPIAARRESFEALGVTTVHDNATVVAQSRHILLAIKPQTLPQVAAQLQAIETDKQIVLSIMAGVSTDKIEQAIRKHAPDAIVLGFPLNMDGSKGVGAQKAEQLATQIRTRSGIDVHLYDERLTSFAADQELRQSGLTHQGKKDRRDALAAAAILRDFLEGKK